MYATGRGIKADPVEAARWHLIAKAGGDNDQSLDDFMRNMKPPDRAMAGEQGEALDRAHEPGRTRPRSRRRRPVPIKSQPVKP